MTHLTPIFAVQESTPQAGAVSASHRGLAARLSRFAGIGLLGATLFAASVPAHAWGDREQGILTGVAAAVFLGHLANEHRESKAHRHHPAPRYQHPAPVAYGPTHVDHYKRYRPEPAPVVVYRQPRETVIIEREVSASTKVCREVPVKNQNGRILEFRQVCD